MNTQPNHVLHQPSGSKPIPWYEPGERAREILDQFPDPDLVVPSSNSTGKKLYWNLSTLHAEARRRDASNDSKMLKGNVK